RRCACRRAPSRARARRPSGGRPWRDSRSYRGSSRDETELRYLVELAHLVRQLEECVEPGALARAEAVAQLLEVAGEEPRGIAIALGGLVGERLRLGPRCADGGDERLFELGELRIRGLGRGPDG